MIKQFIGVEFDGFFFFKFCFVFCVKDQVFKNGFIVMGISGIIDGVEGEIIIICFVSLLCIFFVVWYIC